MYCPETEIVALLLAFSITPFKCLEAKSKYSVAFRSFSFIEAFSGTDSVRVCITIALNFTHMNCKLLKFKVCRIIYKKTIFDYMVLLYYSKIVKFKFNVPFIEYRVPTMYITVAVTSH